MSGIAGIFKFDPRDRIDPQSLADLAHHLERIGPDGGRTFLHASVGMAYRAFHTTSESRYESQPVERPGFLLTWDGRLDNRDEIASRCGCGLGETTADAELVAAAFESMGTACFASLIGDWALALWDRRRHRAILARDAMGVRRLFYRVDLGGVAWSTTVEPLVLTSPQKLHLDLEYLAACIYPRPPLEATPFREIRAIPPSQWLSFEFGGSRRSEIHWSLEPGARIRYRDQHGYEEHFRMVFGQAVQRRLRADRAVLAELSGGIDSSSIVCMADSIRAGAPGPTVETVSYFDLDEPGGDERAYFTAVERQRGRDGHHLSLAEFLHGAPTEAFEPLRGEFFRAVPGYSMRSLRWARALSAIHAKTDTRVVLSGVGGDELLGGIQYEAPELAEYLRSGKIISLLRACLAWSSARKKPVYRLLADTFELLLASTYPERLVRGRISLYGWCRLRPSSFTDSVRSFAHWRRLPPVSLSMESARYVLAQQLTCMEPPLAGCVERRYPFLDRDLYTFLAAIPRDQVLRAGHRRDVMRRALRGIVPDEVLVRRTKWFGARSPAVALSGALGDLEGFLQSQWITDGTVVEKEAFLERLKMIEHGSVGEIFALEAAMGIEQWLRGPIAAYVVPPDTRITKGDPNVRSAAMRA